jgi:NAD(P)H dehydrogenase (quinone)
MTTIAVTGATGKLGGRVPRRLADAGITQRLLVRDLARPPRLDGAHTAAADYGDPQAAEASPA